MSENLTLGAINYSQCEYLYEQVMDEKNVRSALDKLSELDTKTYAPGNSGIELNTDIASNINNLKAASFKSEHGALWVSRMDYEASKLLWSSLSCEDNVDVKIQFSDRRIWMDLTLNHFQPYITERWGDTSDIASRLFINGGLTGGKLIRQTISRLWWHAYLTHDGDHENEWHLLDTLCSNSDVLLAITDRPRISHSKIILMRLLSYLELDENKEILKGDTIKQFTKWVIAYAGVMELTIMEEGDFNDLMNLIKHKILTV